jgi:hypothetical protein
VTVSCNILKGIGNTAIPDAGHTVFSVTPPETAAASGVVETIETLTARKSRKAEVIGTIPA